MLCTAATAVLAQASTRLQSDRNGISDEEIVLGQSLGKTGYLSSIAREVLVGQAAYFQSVNKNGGVHGRQIRVLSMDDGSDALKAHANAIQLVRKDKVFALFNFLGTLPAAAALPVVEENGVPFFTPFSGGEVFRNPVRPEVFNVRASYFNEIKKIVQHIQALGTARVAVVFQNDDFGREGLAVLEQLSRDRGISFPLRVSVDTDLRNMNRALAMTVDANVGSLVVLAEGQVAVDFVRTFRKVKSGMPLYTVSAMGMQGETLKSLGAQGVGVMLSTVLPYPWGMGKPLTVEYQNAMRSAGFKNFSYTSFEAYINAKVLTEGIRRAGRNVSRRHLIKAMESLHDWNLEGLLLEYRKSTHQGSRWVDLTMILPNERFSR